MMYYPDLIGNKIVATSQCVFVKGMYACIALKKHLLPR